MGRRTHTRSRTAFATLALAGAASLGAVASASADVGALTHRGCLTASASATTICTPLAGGALDGLADVFVSPDGRNVYGAGENSDAIATFARDPAGALAYAGCVSSDSELTACSPLPGAVSGGDDTPLSDVTTLAVSPDGRSLYATSRAQALVRFDREPATGALAYAGCVSGRSGGLCTPLPGATSSGAGTALATPRTPVLSADGANLYVIAQGSDAISRFTRDPASGAISYAGCIGSNSAAACTHILGAASGGTGTGLNQMYEIALSGDGRSLYSAAFVGDAVARFAVSPAGTLSYAGCITSNSDVANCTELPGASAGGSGTALDGPMSLAVSPDDRHVYATGRDGDVVAFARDPATGALAFASCVTGSSAVAGCSAIPSATADGQDSGLDGPRSIALSGDGRDVYVSAEYDSAVARLARDPATGALTFVGCHGGDALVAACVPLPAPSASASGLNAVEALTVSSDGRSLYTVSAIGDALTRFDRETPPAPPPGDDTGPPPPLPVPKPSANCRGATPIRAKGLTARQRPRRRRAGVRVRLALDRAGQLRVTRARLSYRRRGKRRSVALAPRTARANPRTTLRLPIPARARVARGAKAQLRMTLRARSGPSCRFGPARRFTVRARVV